MEGYRGDLLKPGSFDCVISSLALCADPHRPCQLAPHLHSR